MQIRAIRDLTNSRLAGEQLTYSQLLPYFDAVVDDINARLHAKFKVLSEVSTADVEKVYEEFPDKYIRTVVCVGAAYKWYVDDEEGIATAESLGQEYQNNLFIMERDYLPLIPEEKRRDDKGGFFSKSCDKEDPCNFWNPDIRYIERAGYKGTSVTALAIKDVDGAKHLYATYTDQEFGSKTADVGILNPNIVAFDIDTNGDMIAVLTDRTIYKVGANLYELIDKAISEKNPPIAIYQEGNDLIAELWDGSTKVIGSLPHINSNSVFTTFGTETPPSDAEVGSIQFNMESLED